MDHAVLIIAAILALILYAVAGRFYRFYLLRQRFNKIPGPKYAIPFVGMVFEMMSVPKEDYLEWFNDVTNRYKDGFMGNWIGFVPTVHIQNPKHLEVVLRSNTQITKGVLYDNFVPWLGRGLFTSTGGRQWFHNRKLITPAFHFSMLEKFAEVMIDKAAILNSCIEREIKNYGDKPFDIFELCLRCTLDVICETAMGTDIHAQEDIENEYLKAVNT